MTFFKIDSYRLMKNTCIFFSMFIFSITTFAQQEIISASWTQINSGIPRDRFVPRELFKINDSTLYLGCRYYLLRVFKDSLRLELKVNGSENVIRSVVGYDSTIYVSAKGNLVLEKMNDVDWVDIMNGYTARGDINWEMVEYNSELIYSSWPRWLEYYNFEAKTWTSSSMLDQRGQGVIADFKKTDQDLFVALYGGGVYKKDRTKDDWLDCNKGMPENLNVRGMEVVDNKLLFAATEDGVYYTSLKSMHWKLCQQTKKIETKYVDLMYHNGILYATGINGELMVSKDQGKHWNRVIINGATGYVLYSIEAMGQDLYLSADGQGKKPSGVFSIPIHTIASGVK